MLKDHRPAHALIIGTLTLLAAPLFAISCRMEAQEALKAYPLENPDSIRVEVTPFEIGVVPNFPGIIYFLVIGGGSLALFWAPQPWSKFVGILWGFIVFIGLSGAITGLLEGATLPSLLKLGLYVYLTWVACMGLVNPVPQDITPEDEEGL